MLFDKNKVEDDKFFYKPGDIVILRHEELANRVPMYIVEKVLSAVDLIRTLPYRKLFFLQRT